MDKAKIKKLIKNNGVPKHLRGIIKDSDINTLFGSVKLRNNVSVADRKKLALLKRYILDNGVPDFMKNDDLAIGTVFAKTKSGTMKVKSKCECSKKQSTTKKKVTSRKAVGDKVLIKDLKSGKTFILHQEYEPGKIKKYKLKYLRRETPREFIFNMNGFEVPLHRKSGKWFTPRDGLEAKLLMK